MNKIKNLQDTFIFKHLNNNDRLNTLILKIIKNGTIVTKDNMQSAYLVINKNYKYALKNAVLNAVENNKIIMMYSPEGVKMPSCMPWFLTKDNKGNIVAIVCVDVYGTRNANSTDINIDPKKLYVMLEGAYLGLIYANNPKAISINSNIITNGSLIYSQMFTKILNKKYSLNINRDKQNKFIFLASKFFMINMLGMEDNDVVFNYALSNCKSPNNIIIRELDDAFPVEAYESFDKFLLELINNQNTKDFIPGLNVRGYLESFIQTYDGSALLALESFPYFMYNVISVVDAGFINNQYIFEDIVDTFGAKMYISMTKYVE